ncbi:MAG TPA: stage III sporulation protein AF [Clostridiales bacterium]|nr:stage III sporulation protein AF [Clostridiales bacterium]
MDRIYEWVRSIVIYMILNTVIMNLIGKSSYKKYISVISGMILVLIIITPILEIMKIEDTIDLYIASSDSSMEVASFKDSLRKMEEDKIDEIFAQYKENIWNDVETILQDEELKLADLSMEINQDENSPTFGYINKMNIKMKKEEEADSKKEDFIQFKRIEIDPISFSKNSKKDEANPPSPIEIRIKNKLSDFYNIKGDNINISIQ